MSVAVTLEEHVLTIRIDRPEKRNAIDPPTRAALRAAWDRLRDDDDAWVGILTGTGDRAFCAGADLGATNPPDESFAKTHFSAGGRDELWQPIKGITKPIIAAINGGCYGGGLELALACDLRIASTNAVFAQSEVRVGSMVGAGGSVRLMRAVPPAVAMKMLMTGQKIDAAEAHRVGLVSDLCEPADLMPFAMDLARTICKNAPLAVRATKMSAELGLAMAPEHALEVERLLWGALRNTEDRIEGRRAFQEKRPPAWKGA